MSESSPEELPEWVENEEEYWRTKYMSMKESYAALQEQHNHLQHKFTTAKMTGGPGAGSVVNENPEPMAMFGSLAQYIQVFLAVIGGVMFFAGFVSSIGVVVQVIGGAVSLGSFSTFLYHEWRKQGQSKETSSNTQRFPKSGLPPEVAKQIENNE